MLRGISLRNFEVFLTVSLRIKQRQGNVLIILFSDTIFCLNFCFKICFNFKGIIQLEKELANLGGSCAAALMKKDLALPIGKSHSEHRLYFIVVSHFCIGTMFKS